MRGDIVTIGSSCGIHGCQRITVTYKGGGNMVATHDLINDKEPIVDVEMRNKPVSVAVDALNPQIGVTISPKDTQGLKVGLKLVCGTSKGAWEYLLVNEGEILLIDGQCIMVKRRQQ